MRAAAIILLFLVIGFVVNAILVFTNPSYRGFLQTSLGKENQNYGMNEVGKLSGSDSNPIGDSIQPSSLQSDELERTLNRLADGLQAISGASQSGTENPSNLVETSSGETDGAPVEKLEIPTPPQPPKSLDLPLFLQAKLYPEYSFKKFDSKSPFGVSVFANLEFATYRDTNRNVRIYVFKDSYATTIANFRMATNVYTVKEVDAFFEKNLFLEYSEKNDGMVRFVILEKTGVYGFEMPKGQYTKIKTYLQSK